MILQTVLPFKIEKTNDKITPHSGLALFGEFTIATGMLEAIDRYLPATGSKVGYMPSGYVYPLLLMLNGWGIV